MKSNESYIPIKKDWIDIKYNKYLLDIQGNKEILLKLFKNQKALLKAPTGSGKTYSLIELAKLATTETGKKIIIAVPKKKQAEQIEKEYNIPCVTGDTKKIDSNSKIIACVYDSIQKVFSLKDWPINSDVTVIIDESHRMRYDSIFRHNALKRIKNVIKDTNIIYISATTKIIEDIQFDIKISCTSSKVNYNYNACYFFDYTSTSELALLGLINHINNMDRITKLYTDILVFWDNKKKLENIKEIFENYGYTVELLTSETKEEKAMNTLVATSKLTGAKIYLCTSVIEEGINIKNKNKFACIYVMDNTTSYDSIEQACARLRTDGHDCFIMRRLKDETIKGGKVRIDINKKLEEARKKVEALNISQKTLKEAGFEQDYILSSFDGLSKNKEFIYNKELDSWQLDEDRLVRGLTLEVDRNISKNTGLHRNELKRRIKARDFIEFEECFIKTTKTQHELIKELKGEQAEQQKTHRENLLKSINNMSEFCYEVLEYSLSKDGTVTTHKHIPLKEEEHQLIKTIVSDKDIYNICKSLMLIRLDIKETIANNNTDYKEIKTHIRRTFWRQYNKIKTLKEAINYLDLEEYNAGTYYKIRKICDKYINKRIPNDIQVKLYKIINPRYKKQELTQQQQEKVLSLLNDIYKCYLLNDGRVKIGNLKK